MEEIWPEAIPCRDVIVLCNAELQALSSSWMCTHSHRLGKRGVELAACTHAVARADSPRVSISYELRPSFGVGEPVERLGEWMRGQAEFGLNVKRTRR